MKKVFPVATLLLMSQLIIQCKSGLVTTSNKCYNAINSAQAQNKAGDYSSALANFNEVLKQCDAYDAKEKAYAGKATALNGLHQYNDALAAAGTGLKINKNSLDNLFAKVNAEEGLGMHDAAAADLKTINNLTSKNRNTAERANMYAKLAEVNTRQKNYPEALQNIRQAMTLDPGNLDFYEQQGDIHAASGNLSEAMNDYDEAIAKGKNDAEAWKSKTVLQVKILQKKYGTDNAGELAGKMNSAEKKSLCETISKGQSRGMKDMTIDLLQTSVCK
jgi:tetratricopeptide (TPR) repeat protein